MTIFVNRKTQKQLTHLLHVQCCRARAIVDTHQAVNHDESTDALPKFECGYPEIKMKGETPPMRVLLVVDSSTGFRGATNVIQKGGGSGFAAIWLAKWLGSTGYARIESAM